MQIATSRKRGCSRNSQSWESVGKLPTNTDEAGSYSHEKMLYLFNTTIMPNEGIFINRKVSLKEALEVCDRHYCPPSEEYLADFANAQGSAFADPVGYQFISAIGHQGSADVFNVLGFCNKTVTVNRIQAQMKAGDEAIALKVLGRLPEGAILTMDELQQVGYEFYHIVNLGTKWIKDTNSEMLAMTEFGYCTDDCIVIPKN